MTAADLIEEVKYEGRIENDLDSTWDVPLLAWLNDEICNFANILEHEYFHRVDVSLSTNGIGTMSLPSDYLKTDYVQYGLHTGSAITRWWRLPQRKTGIVIPPQTSGKATCYDIANGLLHFFPAYIIGSDEIWLNYWAKPTALISGNDVEPEEWIPSLKQKLCQRIALWHESIQDKTQLRAPLIQEAAQGIGIVDVTNKMNPPSHDSPRTT